jgi:hypothetical protein
MQQTLRALYLIIVAFIFDPSAFGEYEAFPKELVEKEPDGRVDTSWFDFRGNRISLKQVGGADDLFYWEKAFFNINNRPVVKIILKKDGSIDRVITIAYDTLGRPVEICQFHGNGQLSRANKYEYDSEGRYMGGKKVIVSVDGNNIKESANVDAPDAFMPAKTKEATAEP